jgi:hypothetical protein
MALKVGQKVVRIEGCGWRKSRRHAIPKRGVVYTVRAIVDRRSHGDRVDGVLLVEIVNPVQPYCCTDGQWRTCEVEILMDCLRPVHNTSIDVFTAMLEPAPRKAADLVEA